MKFGADAFPVSHGNENIFYKLKNTLGLVNA